MLPNTLLAAYTLTEIAGGNLYTDANLYAYYKGEDANDNQDQGTDYNLTNVNSVNFSSFKFNKGADFGNPNANKYLYQDTIGILSYPRAITGWFKASASFDNGNIFAFAQNGNQNIDYQQFKLRSTDNHIVLRTNNQANAADIDTGVTVTNDTEYFFAVNFDSATQIDVYINGTLTNNNAVGYAPSYGINRFALGCLPRTTPLQYFSGYIDDIGIFNRAITQTDVNLLYYGTWTDDPVTFPAVDDLSLTNFFTYVFYLFFILCFFTTTMLWIRKL